MGCVRVLHDSGYSKSHPANFANVCKIRKTLSGSIKILAHLGSNGGEKSGAVESPPPPRRTKQNKTATFVVGKWRLG